MLFRIHTYIFVLYRTYILYCRALNLSTSLDKLKTEILGLKHSVAESLILPAKHSIEDLQVWEPILYQIECLKGLSHEN